MWKISKKVMPDKNGYYFVGESRQDPFWCRKVTYFNGKFYDDRFYLRDDDKKNTDYFNNKKSCNFPYWMDIPKFPDITDEEYYERSVWLSNHEKKMLASAGIDSIDKILNTSKDDLFKIRGFKTRAFSNLLNSMQDYEYPTIWGDNIDLFRISNHRPEHCERLCRIITGIEAKDIINFRDMYFNNSDAAILKICIDESKDKLFLDKLRENPLYQGEKRRHGRNKMLYINYSTNTDARKYFVEYYGREKFDF